MTRPLALGLAALGLALPAAAQSAPPAAADGPIGHAPAAFLTAAYTSDAAVDPLARLGDLPAVEGPLVGPEASGGLASPSALEAATSGVVAAVVSGPAPIEDPVQFEAPRAPVRMELAQKRRRVVLLPGVSTREPEPLPGPVSETAPAVSGATFARAIVVVGASGQREVRYVDVRGSLDLGRGTSCGGMEIGFRLRGLRSSPLRRGMRGDAVRAAQQLLCTAGFEAGDDGVYDAGVARAVRDLQTAHNEAGRGRRLAVDGVFGFRTRQAVEAAIAAGR